MDTMKAVNVDRTPRMPGSIAASVLFPDSFLAEAPVTPSKPPVVTDVLAAIQLQEFPQGPERFEILGEIDAGGLGLVLKAREKPLNRVVVIKVLLTEFSKEASQETERRALMLLREAHILAQLEHPRIVPVYYAGRIPKSWEKFGLSSGKIFVAMKLIRGDNLHTLLPKLRQLSVSRLLQFFLEILRTIGFMHQQGIIHRDLKPGNIMIEDETNSVFVIDLGLARVQGFIDPFAGSIVGTPGYMAPEQENNEEIDHRVDLYALGLILDKLLSEHSGLTQELKAIIEKAKTENPDQRFQTAEEFEQAIQRFMEGTEKKEKADHCWQSARRVFTLLQARDRQRQESLARCAEFKTGAGPQAPTDKRQLYWEEKGRLDQLEARISGLGKGILRRLERALENFSEHSEARKLLADFYWRQLLGAEQKVDGEAFEQAADRVRNYDDENRYKEALQGDGFLELDSNPSGADVYLFCLEKRGQRFVPGRKEFLGQTPIRKKFAMGSHILVIRKKGFKKVRYHLYLTRQEHQRVLVGLYKPEKILPGFVQIPAGKFIAGGDPMASVDEPQRERRIKELGDFCISQYPVTCAQYLEFLNDFVLSGCSEQIKDFIPATQLGERWPFENGVFTLPQGKEPGCPATNITWEAAKAYCQWLGRKTGLPMRLPCPEEREKAAAGTDGRLFSWGDWQGWENWREQDVPADCCDCFAQGKTGALPVEKTSRIDYSPFNVGACVGGELEYTSEVPTDNPKLVAVMGGGWTHGVGFCNVRRIRYADKLALLSVLGVRACYSLE